MEIEAENLRAQTIQVKELDSDKVYVNNIYPLDNDYVEVLFISSYFCNFKNSLLEF
jgi:hypothetical protein